MKLRKVPFAILALFFIGCSSDDDGVEQESQETSAANFVVIGEDLDTVYQYNYEASSDTGQIFNLSQELGVGSNYLTLREIEDFLSFYSFSNGAFSLAQKDVFTGATASYNDFYVNVPERSLVWGINNFSNVFFAYFSPDTRNLNVLDLNLNGLNGQDFLVDFSVDFLFQPLFYNDKIFMTYRDNQDDYKLTFYDTLSKSVGSILNFDGVPISILINENGDLVVVKNGTDLVLEIYDSDTLSFLESLPLELNSGFAAGPIEDAVLTDDRLYYAFPYIQPARFTFGPAIYDISSQENTVIDLFGIVEQIELELGASIAITVQSFSRFDNVFFLGYGVLGNEVKGGVLQISTEGELLENTEVPFFPTYFVKD